MAALFQTGRIVDVIIALTVIEAILVVVYHRVTGRGVAPRDFIVNLLSGLCLMMAVRGALVGAVWGWIGVWLFLAGAAHIFDLLRRWRP